MAVLLPSFGLIEEYDGALADGVFIVVCCGSLGVGC